jgi:YHS domain-containing protein
MPAPKAKGNETTKVNVDSKGVILKGYDAVAYFTQGKPVKGDPAIKSTYHGATHLFASAADKAAFDKNPAKYVLQYGGFCAYGFLSEYCPTSKDRADLSTTANCTSVEMRLRKKVLEVTSRGISPKRMRMAEVNRISVPKTLAISEDYP